MIKVEDSDIALDGGIMDLLAEYGFLRYGLMQALVESGISIEMSDEMLKEAEEASRRAGNPSSLI